MAISVDWPTGVITVPRLDMTLVQASPEIRELQLADLWSELRALEDGVSGRAFPITVRHTPSVTISGATGPRTFEVTAYYSVEFEDAQYAVNIEGGNSNVSDVAVVNQVSVRSKNSFGLVQTATSGLTTSESAQLDRAVTLAEADEERVGNTWRKRNKDDDTIELEKTFTGDPDGDWTLTETP